MAIVGPAVGYVMGGEFLKYYADIDIVPTKRLKLNIVVIPKVYNPKIV